MVRTSSSWTSASTATATATDTACSCFQKTVTLYDWWLIKAEEDFQGKKIAIAGLAYPKRKPVRVFRSAAITKTYNLFTLETADGVTVLVHGYINRMLTLQNGFSSQVFRHFLFGFPPDWEDCATKCLDGNSQSVAETPVPKKECDPSFSARPVDYGVNNLKNDASKNLSPLSSCHVNVVNLVEDNVAVPPEPSSNHFTPSSEKIDVLEGSKKSEMRSVGKSVAKRSAGLEGISTKNDASGEHSVVIDYNDENVTKSNYDQTQSAGTSGVVLGVTLEVSKSVKKNQKENEGNKDGMENRSNFSRCSLPRGSQAMLRCNGDNITQGPTLGDPNMLTQSANCHVETSVFSSMQSGSEANIISPSEEETATMNVNQSESRSRKSAASLRNSVNIQKQKSVSGRSVKYKAKGLLSDEGKVKGNSGSTLDIAEAMLRASRKLNTLSGKSTSKAKKNTTAVERGGSSTKKVRRKITFDANKKEVKKCIHSSESLSLKRSRSGRVLLPTLDFWRNQIPVYDKNRNITGIQEELGTVNPSRGPWVKSFSRSEF